MAQEKNRSYPSKRQWKCFDCSIWMNLNETKCNSCNKDREKVQTIWVQKTTKAAVLADFQKNRSNQSGKYVHLALKIFI